MRQPANNCLSPGANESQLDNRWRVFIMHRL